ncbi:MAG: protein phosphatase 2C domain-containing protein [Bifidobacteriaceae bacterium]|nr:protein phosphatase 2C domain-containing protein [Bifidobacteriaceae bacterium]
MRPAEIEDDPLLTEDGSEQPVGSNEFPSLVCDFGVAFGGAVTVRAGTLRGISHHRVGESRQDSYEIATSRSSIHLAVADGAGSQDLSAFGSSLAAKVAVRRSVAGATGLEIGQAVRDAIFDRANADEASPERYSTTLCWLRVEVGDPGEPWPIEFAHWGNSELLVLNPKAADRSRTWRRPAGAPVYANGATPTLPSLTAPQFLCGPDKGVNWHPGLVLALVSDGVGEYLEPDQPLREALARAWQVPPSMPAFVSQLAFRLDRAHDDRTAVVLWRESASADALGGSADAADKAR